ncbi:hypothetical protein JCM33374_g423 [Metschnikowia sp. JCM 33374]|nr:hypothetical protein JCM33374_g423 [Metschnikowia sp. JCM 33374]
MSSLKPSQLPPHGASQAPTQSPTQSPTHPPRESPIAHVPLTGHQTVQEDIAVENIGNKLGHVGLDETTPSSSDAGDTSDESHEDSRDQIPRDQTPQESGVGSTGSHGNTGAEYRGTMVKRLSFFGSFDISPEVLQLKWISDHTSGNVHKDIPTISMLYNQDLTLPEPAQRFIEQSPELAEEARWERLKAAFYSFYPTQIQARAYQVLSNLSVLEASRIIAKKTSQFSHEVILKPTYGRGCDRKDAEELNKELSSMVEVVEKRIAPEINALTTAESTLRKYTSFKLTTTLIFHDPDYKNASQQWRAINQEYQSRTLNVFNLRKCLFHFQHAEATYDPRTQWIHVKTRPLFPHVKESDSLAEKSLQISLFEKDVMGGSSDVLDRETNLQIKEFGDELQTYGQHHFKEFESFHNNDSYEEFEFKYPYTITPDMGLNILGSHLGGDCPSEYWRINSVPQVPQYSQENHEIQVYLNMEQCNKAKHMNPFNMPKPKPQFHFENQTTQFSMPAEVNLRVGSTLRLKDKGFCSNCYAKGHHRRNCTAPKYGFALPVEKSLQKVECPTPNSTIGF